MIFLLLLLLPTQLGIHFWPDWSHVQGIRVDYLSPTLYLADLIIISLMCITPRPPLKLRGGVRRTRVILITLIVLNIFFSLSPLVSIYKWLRVFEYYWLFKYIRDKYSIFSVQCSVALGGAIVWTSVLAWWQFFNQSSVGGFWYWLGERTFNIFTPNIAKVFLDLEIWDLGLVLRPYATFPHPNALAGWLLVAGLLVGGRSAIIAAITIPITFSRTVIVLSLLVLKKRLVILAIPLILFAVFIVGNSDSIPTRVNLAKLAVSTTGKYPAFGVGLGNFVQLTTRFQFQPVHNIYLLAMSELGLPLFIVLSVVIIKSLRYLLDIENWTLKIAILVIALTGMVDHYWLTLSQNQLLLTLVLAFAVKSNHGSDRGIY